MMQHELGAGLEAKDVGTTRTRQDVSKKDFISFTRSVIHFLWERPSSSIQRHYWTLSGAFVLLMIDLLNLAKCTKHLPASSPGCCLLTEVLLADQHLGDAGLTTVAQHKQNLSSWENYRYSIDQTPLRRTITHFWRPLCPLRRFMSCTSACRSMDERTSEPSVKETFMYVKTHSVLLYLGGQ